MTVGVVVTTNTRAGASQTPRSQESSTFIAVRSHRGRTWTPVKVTNPQEYANEFGEWFTGGSGTDFINAHFGLGGNQVYVVRAVGPSATKGTLTLANRVGTPQNAVRLDAISEGDWSQYLNATVVDGTVTNSVTVTISYKAGATGVPDEIYRNVGLATDGSVSVQTIIDAINARSNLVTATNLNPATTTGATARLLAITATALSSGSDDLTNATSMVVSGALSYFPKALGPGMVALPGYLHTDVAGAVGAHCAANSRSGVVGGIFGETLSSIGSAAATIQALANAKYVGIVYPWFQAPSSGSTKWVEPTGYATGVRSRNSERIGVWQEPAGKYGADENGYVQGLATVVDEATNSDLESKGVSALCRVGGQVRLMGWRNLGSDGFDSLSDTDELNAVAWECKVLLQDEVWDGIDDQHINLNKAIQLCKGVVAGRAAVGAYHSLPGDSGYSAAGVEDIPNSRIKVTVGFRRRRAMKEIDLAVTAAAFNAPV